MVLRSQLEAVQRVNIGAQKFAFVNAKLAYLPAAADLLRHGVLILVHVNARVMLNVDP